MGSWFTLAWLHMKNLPLLILQVTTKWPLVQTPSRAPIRPPKLIRSQSEDEPSNPPEEDPPSDESAIPLNNLFYIQAGSGPIATLDLTEFQVMCGTSICEAFFVTFVFVLIGATGFSPSGYSLPRDLKCALCMMVELLNSSCYFLLLLFIGILSSIYYHEATMDHLVTTIADPELVDFSTGTG